MSRVSISCAVFLVVGLAFADHALAARLIHVIVTVDGKPVLKTYYQDSGRADAATVWRYLQDDPIMGDEETSRVQPDQPNGVTATLRGAIRIEMRGAPPLDVDTLLLMREDPTTELWRLPPVEVERTAELQGFGPPKTNVIAGRIATLVAVGGLLLLVAVGLALFALLAIGRKGRPAAA